MDNCICPGVNMQLSIYLTISLCYLMPAAVLKLFPIPPPVPRKASGGRPDGDFTSRCQVHRVPPFLGGGDWEGKYKVPPKKNFGVGGPCVHPPPFHQIVKTRQDWHHLQKQIHIFKKDLFII